ncbi:MAG: phosphate signaling complex protein PhoU [Actinomycetota bacterium]
MVEVRRHFHEQLDDLESIIQHMGEAAGDLFRRSLEAVASDNMVLCDGVIAADDHVDELYMQVERGVVELFALQGPVASDLRLLATLLHVNLHLERVADMGVNVAKIAKAAHRLPHNPTIHGHLQQMGEIALAMLRASLDALARRDLVLARQLPEMDDPLDKLNRGMLSDILEDPQSRAMLEWGVPMHVVSRQIERVGDHAVDIGEQVAYLVTGTFQEFTDASNPALELANKLAEMN